jgi:hypothetical protein
MSPRRYDPAEHAANPPPDTYASIWSELSEAQRSAILKAIGNTEPHEPVEPVEPVEPLEPTPAVRETMHALSRVLLDETIVERPAPPSGPRRGQQRPPPEAAGWGWRPQDNGLVAAGFDPALIVGGSSPEVGALMCQRVTVPAGAPIRSVLLEVVTPGADLTTGAANLAAVYEVSGARAGVTKDQSTAWSRDGLKRSALVQQIPAQDEARSVWVAFIATGGTLPGFAVPWISRAARPNLGLPSPGPQRTGKITGQSTCPAVIIPAEMQPCLQFWVGLA